MPERWNLQDTDRTSTGADARLVVEQRISVGEFETWFESDRGRLIALVTNNDRALLMVLRNEGDPGEHLIDPQEGGRMHDGFILNNGQSDTYAGHDTVPLSLAVDVLASVIDSESHPKATWAEDR